MDMAEKLEEKAGEALAEKIIEEAYDMKSEGNVTYGAENGEGIGVMLTYIADESLSIAVTQTELQED